MKNSFMESLYDKNRLSITWELVPGRGAREKSQEEALESAETASRLGKIDALTVTDNPGGNPAILADYLAMKVLALGIEPLVHFTCKDKNRNQIESQLYALDREGVNNLLIMTGDYGTSGYKGRPRPVFDLDPTHVLELIEEMNNGLEIPGKKGPIRHQVSHFFAGAVVSPFKSHEAELMAQYFKLRKKIESGAKFIITQLGYDARKFHEILQFLKLSGYDIPLIGNIYILSLGVAKMMNQNKIPGCVVTDKLLAQIKEESKSSDKGVEARFLRAAKMYAFLKGMGYDGVQIGGHNIKYEQVEYIIEKGEELSTDWAKLIPEFDYPQENGFYYFTKDEKTGLNTKVLAERKPRPSKGSVHSIYKLSRFMHNLMFEPDKGLFNLMQKTSKAIKGSNLEGSFHKAEHLAKVALYDCQDCGDCALQDLAYICPMSQCPKNKRNGVCGGSFNGRCEINPDEQCIYVKAYDRLRAYGEEDKLVAYQVPPVDWDLFQTSSWINFYLGKDHSSVRYGVARKENELEKSNHPEPGAK